METICNYHGGCDKELTYSGRGKRSPLCDEHKTVVRREKAKARDRARRKDKRAAKLRFIRENFPKCCVDWIGDNLRRRTCPQHQEWARISYQNVISIAERFLTDEDKELFDILFSTNEKGKTWGARVARNPDDWWNDKEVKLVKVTRRITEEVWLEIPTTPIEDGRGDVTDPRKRDDSLPDGLDLGD